MTSDKSDKISGGETLRWSNGLLTRKIRIVTEHPYHKKTLWVTTLEQHWTWLILQNSQEVPGSKVIVVASTAESFLMVNGP